MAAGCGAIPRGPELHLLPPNPGTELRANDQSRGRRRALGAQLQPQPVPPD